MGDGGCNRHGLKRGGGGTAPNFRPMSIVAKWPNCWIKMPLAMEVDLGPGDIVRWGSSPSQRKRGAGSPSNTMSLGLRPISLPSGILIHPAVWQFGHNGHGPKIGGCAPPFRGSWVPSNNVACAEAYQSTTMPSFMLIHPTVWPQYTQCHRQNRQTDRTDTTVCGLGRGLPPY